MLYLQLLLDFVDFRISGSYPNKKKTLAMKHNFCLDVLRTCSVVHRRTETVPTVLSVHRIIIHDSIEMN